MSAALERRPPDTVVPLSDAGKARRALTAYRDDELLALLPYARGYDREFLIHAMGDAVEVPGAGAVAELERIFRSEKGHSQTAALYALGKRLGAAATPHGVEALHSTYWGLQEIGSTVLADHGGQDGAAELFAWFERKAKAKDRRDNWGRYEMLTIIRFGVRHGLQGDVAGLLVKHWDCLSDDERLWLERYWPSMFDRHGRPRAVEEMPPPTRVGTDMEDELRSPLTDDEKAAGEAIVEARHAKRIHEAYLRVCRRMEKAQTP